MIETNNTSGGPVFSLLPIAIILEVIDTHHGSAVVANSTRVEKQRTIVVKLCRSHPLVARSLANADALILRFLVGIALGEYCMFWGQTSDGAAVRNALKKLAGFAAGDRAWGTQFASRLADCGAMKAVDALPVYSPMGEINSPIGETGPFPLFTFEATLRSPSDIPRWRSSSRGEGGHAVARDRAREFGRIEMPEPPEPPFQAHSSHPGPVAAAEPSPRALRRQEQRSSRLLGSIERIDERGGGGQTRPVLRQVSPGGERNAFRRGFHRVGSDGEGGGRCLSHPLNALLRSWGGWRACGASLGS